MKGRRCLTYHTGTIGLGDEAGLGQCSPRKAGGWEVALGLTNRWVFCPQPHAVGSYEGGQAPPPILASSVLGLAPLGGQAIAPAHPPPGLSSPQCREASRVPAETTKSPVAFSKIPEEAARDESGPLAALLTQNQPGAQSLSMGWGWGQGNRGLQRPHPWLALWVGDPRCVLQQDWLRDTSSPGPWLLFSPGPALLGSVCWDPEAFSRIFPCSTEDTRRG